MNSLQNAICHLEVGSEVKISIPEEKVGIISSYKDRYHLRYRRVWLEVKIYIIYGKNTKSLIIMVEDDLSAERYVT